MRNKLSIAFSFLLFTISIFTFAAIPDTVVVDVNLDVKHSVGGISTFDRAKFVTLHADITEQEWDGANEVSDLRDDFLNGYDVYMGRNTGGITWNLNNQITEDLNRTGFADSTSISQFGQTSRNNYALKTNYHAYENRNAQIMCAQLHPFWPDGQLMQKGWALSQTDTEAEPFGTATGEYMGRFIRDFFGSGGTTGQNRPNLVEVINEPLWHLVDYGNEQPEKIFRFHNAVAKEIKKYNDNIDVGGFCTAFPDLEKNDFQQWEERWKLFMDVAGENMDFWTIHLYDFPSINNGKQLYRKGAQMEATFDMIEHYSYLKFGEVKPFMVSEFGAQMHDYFGLWSPMRDWLHIKSCSPMMMQFMRRPNLINKAINFTMLKAEWGYNNQTGASYNHRLLRKKNEPASYTGEWVYSDMLKHYQLWSDVKGIRVDSKANYLDIISDSYVDGKKVYVLVNNYDLQNSHNISINLLGSENTLESVKIKHLHLAGNAAEMEETITTDIPNSIEIAPEGTLILEYTYSTDIELAETSNEIKHYASEYYKPIVGKQTLFFDINDVETGEFGEATLRLGIGRIHGKEIYPELTINGTPVNYDKNYRGDDQSDRPSFFGVLEIDVPYNLIQKNNNLSVKFPDSGGYVSSVAMQVYKFSRELKRFHDIPTNISSFENSGFKLFPNPVKNEFTISSPINNMVTSIDIYSLSGTKILSRPMNSQSQKIAVSGLTNGVYTVKINTAKNRISKKLIVQN
jgi:agarase